MASGCPYSAWHNYYQYWMQAYQQSQHYATTKPTGCEAASSCADVVKCCPVKPNPCDIPALQKATKFDGETEVENILVWPSPVIPADKYHKFQSVNYSLGFFFNVDMFTVPSTDESLSVFLTNKQDRGFDVTGDDYKKRAYMWAFNCENSKKYATRMDNMLNAWYQDIVTSRKPLLSSFQQQLVRFFLNVHVGDDDYPDYVIKYFTDFIDIIGFADPSRPGRQEQMLSAHANTDCIRAYFRKRREIVMQNKLEDTIFWHWVKAGVPEENLVMEGVHNMVAFSQFNNTMFKIVSNQVTPPPSGANYFQKFKEAAGDAAEQLNVIREIFRLEVPNQVSFSRLDGTSNTQTRHVHQAIMVANEGGPAQYANYDTSRYDDFSTDFEQCEPAPPLESPVQLCKVAQQFIRSPIDDSTELPKDNPKMIPVFDPPIYTPFGLGYRRCAGEIFTYMFTLKLLQLICDVDFYIDGNITEPLVPLAPFFAVPDNLFVVQVLP